MVQARKMAGGWVFLACFACLPAHAQNVQFLPEIDAYLTVKSNIRVYVETKEDRDGGDPEQFTFGPSIQYYLKPWLRLKRVTVFDLDDTKSRPLILESGYRLIKEPNSPSENRALESVTSHFPLVAGILASDRNRVDLDWKNGVFSWRYRNKLTLQRTFAIRSYHFVPYVAAEVFYESQYSKFSSTDLYAGCLFPVGKHVEFDSYYEHENDTGKSPNRQENYIGLALYLYFSLKSQPLSPSPVHKRNPKTDGSF